MKPNEDENTYDFESCVIILVKTMMKYYVPYKIFSKSIDDKGLNLESYFQKMHTAYKSGLNIVDMLKQCLILLIITLADSLCLNSL